jgi:hypothetical protein
MLAPSEAIFVVRRVMVPPKGRNNATFNSSRVALGKGSSLGYTEFGRSAGETLRFVS